MHEEDLTIRIARADAPEQLETVHMLFMEYASHLGVDLAFQQFDAELASLPGDYAPPAGALLLVSVNGQAAGCCGLRPIQDVDYGDSAEMKRLFVREVFRGFGLGRQLAEAALEAAGQIGYRHVLLDTLSDMAAARSLYLDLGFEEIPPYYRNPLPGAHYLCVRLR